MTDDVGPKVKEGVTLLLVCVKDALLAGVEGRGPLNVSTLKARGYWAAAEGYSVENPDPAFRVSCERCVEKHRLVPVAEVAARGGLAFVDEDCAVLVETLVDETGLVGAAAVERMRPIVRAKVQEFLKVGRNDPCPCGSGKKAKKCCGQA